MRPILRRAGTELLSELLANGEGFSSDRSGAARLPRGDRQADCRHAAVSRRGWRDDSYSVIRKEFAFATTCFAHAAAVLLGSGLAQHNQGCSIARCRRWTRPQPTWRRGRPRRARRSFTHPATLLLEHFRKVAPPDRAAKWQERAAGGGAAQAVQVQQARGKQLEYRETRGAEQLLIQRGHDLDGVFRSVLARPSHGLHTPRHVQRERNPLAYDHFSRYFLSGILHLGYRGESFRAYRDLVWRGAWTSLLLQSPFGELPAGYRSAHHIWNEAEAAAMYEVSGASSHAQAVGQRLEGSGGRRCCPCRPSGAGLGRTERVTSQRTCIRSRRASATSVLAAHHLQSAGLFDVGGGLDVR